MRSEAQYIWDIIESADAIDRFLKGRDFSQFEADEILRSAVHAKLIIVGEAVSHLSNALTEKYPSIPWQKIRGFRNAVIHGYFKVDWEVIWRTATKNVRDLRDTAMEMLEHEFPQFRPENL